MICKKSMDLIKLILLIFYIVTGEIMVILLQKISILGLI